MEGNKDEALKCLHLATQFFSSGHREKAKKFTEKSLRLYPTSKAAELLKEIESDEPKANGSTHSENVRRRRRTNSGHKEQQTEEPEPVEKNYTDEQVKDTLRIKNCKDYYEVLGVSTTPTESELKKCYRKLALQFHPDKNQAPGATEAFKRIGVAFGVLSDPEKKRKYDTYGENLGPTATRSSRRRAYHEDEFEGDISPEDLFNMFFGGGFPDGRVHVRRGRNHQRTFFTNQNHQNESVSSMYPIVQILPVLLIILFSLLSSFLIPEPIYSFQRTSQYRYVMTTSRYSIQYFVKDHEIRNKYSDEDFHTIEQKVEREFLETLQVRCYRERQYKAELYHQGRLWGSSELLDKAKNYNADSCDRLNQLQQSVQ